MDLYTINIDQLSVEFQAIFSAFEPSWLILEHVTKIDLPEGKTKISGQTKSDWINEEIGLSLSKVEIVLIESGSDLNLEIFSITGTEMRSNQTITWSGSNSGIGTLIFSSHELNENPLNRSEAEKLPFFAGLNTLINLIEFEKFSYQLHLSALPSLRLSYHWSSVSELFEETSVGSGLFSISQLRLNGAVFDTNTPNLSRQISRNQHVELITTVALGSEQDLKSQLSFVIDNNSFYTFQIIPETTSLFANFSNLLKALRLTDFEGLVDTFNEDIGILKNFEINRVIVQADKENLSTINRIALFGAIHAHETSFDFRLDYANEIFSLDLRMKNDQSVELTTLLGSIIGEDIHLPSSPSIHAFQLNGSLNPFTYRFYIRITDLWSINIGEPNGNRTIDLTAISLRTSRNTNGEFAYELGASLLILGIDMELSALRQATASEPGWLLETRIAHEKSISLQELIDQLSELFNFTVPNHLPDIDISEIDLSFHTVKHNFHFHIVAELKSALGPFNGGTINLNVELNKKESGKHEIAISLECFVQINEVEVDFIATNIGQADWNAAITYDENRHEDILTLEALCQHFDPHFKIENEELASLALSHVEIAYAHSAEANHSCFADLQLTSKNGTRIEGFFSGQHADNKWHIAAGIGYEHGDHVNTPEIIESVTTHFTLEACWIIFISSSGKWPQLPESFPEAIKDQEVSTGLGLVAKIALDQHDFVGINELTKRGHSVLDIFAEITTNGLRVEADLEGDFRIETGEKSDIVIQAASLVFMLGATVALIIKGKFDLHIDGFEQTLEVGLIIQESGFELFADLKFSGKGWTPFGLEGMHIDELAFELGVDFLPPEIRVGFMGFSHIGEITPPKELKDVQDEFAMILGFSSEIPNPEYFALKITKLGLSDLLGLFPGSSAHGHGLISDTTFSVNNFELIWCEKPLILPNGRPGEIGFSCHGLVTIFGWKAYASLEIHPESGIQGSAFLETVHLGPLRLTGKSDGIKLPKGTTNIKVAALPNEANPPIFSDEELEVIIKPGGAMVQFNSASSPFLLMSFNLQLLGIEVAHLDAEITNDKVSFDFGLNLIILNIGVKCTIQKGDSNYFSIEGRFFLGVDFHIKIDFVFIHIDEHIVCGIEAKTIIKEENGVFSIRFEGSANFFGHHVQLADIEFDARLGDLKKLPNELMNYVRTGHGSKFSKHVKDASGWSNRSNSASDRQKNAQIIFDKANEWADYVHRDLQKLQNELRHSPDFIQQIILDIKADIQKLNKGIGGLNAPENKEVNSEEDHINHLAKIQSLNEMMKVKDADQQRRDDIARMEWEMKWINDEASVLNGKIQAIWNDFEEELNRAEQHLILAQEQRINALISEVEFSEIELKRDAVFNAIKTKAADLVDENSKPYPTIAVQHHLQVIELQKRAILVFDEIITIANQHAEAIRKGAIRPQDQETFILNPLDHE